jgi:hypothetical protein
MTCDEKRRLLGQYDDATLAFSNAVQELRRGIGTSGKDEYERLERISTEARDRSEQTRLALEQHIAVHRCWSVQAISFKIMPLFALQTGQLSLWAAK